MQRNNYKTSVKKFKVLIFIVLTILFLVVFRYSYLSYLVLAQPMSGSHTIVYDRKDRILYEQPLINESYFQYKTLDSINPFVIHALVSSEDKTFFYNNGIDPVRTLYCVYSTVFKGARCGASTISQQYIKHKLATDKRTILAKIDEFVLSIIINLVLTKDQILERYLNTVDFGNMRYGIESASQGYFDKSNTQLDLSDSALLIGIINSPIRFDPYLSFDNLEDRKKVVLLSLLRDKKISNSEYKFALSKNINLKNKYSNIFAPHFVNMVLEDEQYKTEQYNILQSQSDGIYKTTLDIDLYDNILKSVKSHLEYLHEYNASNASVIVQDIKSGEILVLVGSADYFSKDIEGQVNVALSPRSPGSTLKPFVYAQAFSKNLTPATLINDQKQIIKTSEHELYFPQNYDFAERGWVSARQSLANSYNIPAVLVLNEVRIEEFYEFMDKVGLEEIREQKSGLSSVLGGCSVSLLDLVNAYRYLVKPNQISKSKKLLSEDDKEVMYLIYDILSDQDAKRN